MILRHLALWVDIYFKRIDLSNAKLLPNISKHFFSPVNHLEQNKEQWYGTAEQPAFGIGHRVKLAYFLDTITGTASIRDKIIANFVYIAEIFLVMIVRSGANNVG